MKVYYDLHIHSVLSPCADVLMTPNNLLNMAMLKGLNLISITDHNSLKQYPILMELSKSYDFVLVPGVEITTQEGIHCLVYFKTIDDAYQFEAVLDHHRQPLQTYAEAAVCDIEDNVIRTYSTISSEPLRMTFDELCQRLHPYDHLLFLAHLDRKQPASLLVYTDSRLNGIELMDITNEDFITTYHLKQYRLLSSSDAHDLMQILEKGDHNVLDLPNVSIESFFKEFSHE